MNIKLHFLYSETSSFFECQGQTCPFSRQAAGKITQRDSMLIAGLGSQRIALFNLNQFYHLVRKHNSERYAKGYDSWDHDIAMLFCQLAQAKSL
jgi:hypothetical protein